MIARLISILAFILAYFLIKDKFYAMLVISGIVWLAGYFKGCRDTHEDCVGGFKNED